MLNENIKYKYKIIKVEKGLGPNLGPNLYQIFDLSIGTHIALLRNPMPFNYCLDFVGMLSS